LQNTTRGTSCTLAPKGAIVGTGGSAATAVAPGWYMTQCNTKGQCRSSLACEPGTVGADPATMNCTLCAAGKTSYKAALFCQPCETGKYASDAGSPKCQVCDRDQREYSDTESSTLCKICQVGKISIGKECSDVSVNSKLPVPQNIVVVRASKINFTALIVTWSSNGHTDANGNNGYDVQISSSSAFLAENTRQLNIVKSSTTSIILNVPNIKVSVSYFQVRSIGVNRHDVGTWSAISKAWPSTDNQACASSTLFLNTSSLSPTNWTCQPCPRGAWCFGSVTWDQVAASRGFWRDRENPRFFAQCADKIACLGPCSGDAKICPDVTDNRTSGCNEAAGYQRECINGDNGDNDQADHQKSCRICSTCAQGWAKDADGITCSKCPNSIEARANGVWAGIGIMLLVLFIFAVLIFLKVKSATSGGHGAKTKAVHSTIKRIVLTHMQIVALCLSLSVPWPNIIVTMMNIFSSLSSVSQHVMSLSCFVDESEPVVGRQASFSYLLTGFVLMVPVVFGAALFLWWIVLVPIPCCGWMSCGLRKKLVKSRVCCCGKSNDGKKTYSRTRTATKTQRRMTNKDIEQLQDTTVKTRDVFTYSIVLFVYMMYPSLVRVSMSLLSCRMLDSRVATAQQPTLYLRSDMEEVCWKGRHLRAVLGLALPGLLLYAVGIPLVVLVVLWRHRHLHYINKYIFTFGLLYSGYRSDRWWWENVVLLRKFLVIVVCAFLYEDSMQLHFMMIILIIAFALHHTYLPFHVQKSEDTSPPEEEHYSNYRSIKTGSESHFTENGLLLHRLERNSLICLLLLLWSANVFVISDNSCNDAFCVGLTVICLVSNIIFLIQGMRLFTKYFLQRTKLAQHVGKLIGRSNTLDQVSQSLSIFDRGSTTGDQSRREQSQDYSNPAIGASIEMTLPFRKKRGKVNMNPLAYNGKGQAETKDEGNGSGSGNGTEIRKSMSSGKQKSILNGREDEILVDPSTGRRYFVNSFTGESSWVEEEEENKSEKTTKMMDDVECEDEIFVDSTTGRRYLVNGATGESRWVVEKIEED